MTYEQDIAKSLSQAGRMTRAKSAAIQQSAPAPSNSRTLRSKYLANSSEHGSTRTMLHGSAKDKRADRADELGMQDPRPATSTLTARIQEVSEEDDLRDERPALSADDLPAPRPAVVQGKARAVSLAVDEGDDGASEGAREFFFYLLSLSFNFFVKSLGCCTSPYLDSQSTLDTPPTS